jgi:hypothetical protein
MARLRPARAPLARGLAAAAAVLSLAAWVATAAASASSGGIVPPSVPGGIGTTERPLPALHEALEEKGVAQALPPSVFPRGTLCGNGWFDSNPGSPTAGWGISVLEPIGLGYAYVVTRTHVVYDDSSNFDNSAAYAGGWWVQAGFGFAFYGDSGWEGPFEDAVTHFTSGWPLYQAYVTEVWVSTDGVTFDGPSWHLENAFGEFARSPHSCYFPDPNS